MGLLLIDNGGHKLVAIYKPNGDIEKTSYHTSWRRTGTFTKGDNTSAADAPSSSLNNTKSTSSVYNSTRLVSSLNCVGIDCDGNRHVGNALLSLQHYHDLILRRPVERGYIVDCALQAHIWLHCVIEPLQIVDESCIDLVLALPYGMPDDVCEGLEQLCFKQFRFKSLTLVSSSFVCMLGRTLHNHNHNKQSAKLEDTIGSKRSRDQQQQSISPSKDMTGIVIDAGFSGTTVTPYIWGRAVKNAIVHLNIGGKHLTNFLKQIISFSQIDLLGDTWLCNQIKEKCCSVSPNFEGAMLAYGQWKRLSHFDKKDMTKAIDSHQKTNNSLSKNGNGEDTAAATIPWPPTVLQYLLPTVGPTKPLGRLLPTANTPEANALKQQLRLHKHLLQHITLKQEAIVVGEMVFSPGTVVGGTPKEAGATTCVGDYGGGTSGGAQPVLGLTDILIRGLWLDRSRKSRSPLYHAPLALREELLANVVVCGGTACNMPGYIDRIEHDLLANMPEDWGGGARSSNLLVDGVDSSGQRIHVVNTCSDSHILPPTFTTTKASSSSSWSDGASSSSFLVTGALGLFFEDPTGTKINATDITTQDTVKHAFDILRQQAKKHVDGPNTHPPTTVERLKCSKEAMRVAASMML